MNCILHNKWFIVQILQQKPLFLIKHGKTMQELAILKTVDFSMQSTIDYVIKQGLAIVNNR
jgi:hypothetical protein